MRGWKPSPLPSSFMLTSIFGLLVSGYWVFPQSFNWGVTFLVFFTMMFVASLVAMVRSPVKLPR